MLNLSKSSILLNTLSNDDFKTRKNILIIEKRNSGMTNLLQDILYYIRKNNEIALPKKK